MSRRQDEAGGKEDNEFGVSAGKGGALITGQKRDHQEKRDYPVILV